jgi:hypothetical protein
VDERAREAVLADVHGGGEMVRVRAEGRTLLAGHGHRAIDRLAGAFIE